MLLLRVVEVHGRWPRLSTFKQAQRVRKAEAEQVELGLS